MSGNWVMICHGFANGVPCSVAGQYLMSFDHEAENGRGFGVYTSDPEKAMRFESAVAAMEFWNKVPACKPTRPDGRPNKPLTASTMQITRLQPEGKL